jgi:hypothetical protein
MFHRTVCGVRPGSPTLALPALELTPTETGMLVLEVYFPIHLNVHSNTKDSDVTNSIRDQIYIFCQKEVSPCTW